MNDLPLARRDLIAARLAAGQPAVAATLALEFGVSEDAIRRVYGGALPLSPASAPMAERVDQARERKDALACAAATLVEPGELVFLDNGSTNLALVKFLPKDYKLTVAAASTPMPWRAFARCTSTSASSAPARFPPKRAYAPSTWPTPPSSARCVRPAATPSSSPLRKNWARAPHRAAAIQDIDSFVLESDAPAAQAEALIQAGAAVLRAA